MNIIDKGKDMLFKAAKGVSNKVKCIYTKVTEFHFEKREKLNGKHPTFEEVSSADSEWILLDKSMSIYHDNKIGKNEMKFVHPDGREAVFDGDTLEPVVDHKYKATYNYVSPVRIPENKLDLIRWMNFGVKGVGHLLMDVVPYYLTGKKNERGK